MRARIIGGLIALVIGALIVLIARNTYWSEITVRTPLRGEAVTNPFYAAQKFTEALGATSEWRQALGTLGDDVDVLVLANWHWNLIEDRRDQIEAWVERGGRLMIDSSLTDDEAFSDWSGIRWDYPDDEEDEDEDADAADEPAQENAEPESDETTVFDPGRYRGVCGKLQPVDESGAVRSNGRTLSVCSLDGYSFLATDRKITWGYAYEGSLQAARVDAGSGSVTVVNAEPFGNRDLMDEDHAKLFVGAMDLRGGDHVVFLSETEQMSLLGLIWLYGAPVVMLALAVIAALLWRGAVRFGPLAAPTDTARRSLAEQIRGTGQFAIRLGDGKALHAAAVRALQEAARRRIAGYERMAQDDRIAAIARKTGLEHEALASALNHLGARRKADLAQTIALVETARRRILE